jgi:hypothetical protein
MAKANQGLIDLECPCCQAELKVDPETRAVISFKEHEKPRSVENLEAAVDRLKGEPQRREDAFLKSVEQHRSQTQVLNRKFEELLKQAQADPNPPRKKDIDFD